MLLAGAIVIEVVATLSLRASQDHSAWLVLVAVGYVGAFVLLTMVLRTGMPVGVAYGIWGALGTAGTAVLAALLFGDPFTWPIARARSDVKGHHQPPSNGVMRPSSSDSPVTA